MTNTRQETPWAAWAAAAGGLLLLVQGLATHRVVVDDAYIAFRYLDNWLGGMGLVFNPGERVEGYTSFLWIVVLAPLRLLGVRPEAASLALSLVSLAALLAAVASTAARLAGSRAAGWAAAILLTGSTPLAVWTGSGMETTLCACLLALGNREVVARGRARSVASIWFCLAVLTRPDAVVPALACLAATLPWGAGQKARGWVLPVLAFAALPLAHLVFRFVYYGDVVPNTFYAKVAGVPAGRLSYGFWYARSFLLEGGALYVACACLAPLAAASRSRATLGLALEAAAQGAYVVAVGGDYLAYHRFLVPVLPALAVLGGVGLYGLFARARGPFEKGLPALALALAAGGALWSHASYQELIFRTQVTREPEREKVARWLLANVPASAKVALNVAGLIPYRTRLTVIDMLGLNDRHIARRPGGAGDVGGASYVGHFKHDGRYVFERRPDVFLPGDGLPLGAASPDDALLAAATRTFAGDREFFGVEGFDRFYRPVVAEVAAGEFVVLYVLRAPGEQIATSPGTPNTVGGWFSRGLDHMRAGRPGEAAEAFRRVLELDPGNWAAISNLGYGYMELKRYDLALQAFREVLRRKRDHYEAVFGLALASQALGDLEEARRQWERFLREAPGERGKDAAQMYLKALEAHGR